MDSTVLFQAPDGSPLTSADIRAILARVGAAEADILYIHTGMTFGLPNPALSRRELLAHLYELLASLGPRTLLFPTFTFSFCNGEDYDVARSRSRMGALNEFVRGLPGAVRSIDPLLSSVLTGAERDLVENLGRNSIGADSCFDRLHRRGGAVRFLFFGTTASECFTYTHYVEERLASPYRYNRPFTGRITAGDRTWEDTYTLFVRYHGVVPCPSGKLERELIRRGMMRREPCGASSISCVSEPDAWLTITEHLAENPYGYIAEDPMDRDTRFSARNMVAL